MRKKILLSLGLTFLLAQPLQANSLESVVVFGDSLSDNGNVSHLLQSLRKEKKASYLEEPFRNYLRRIIHEQAHKLHISKTVEHWGQQIVSVVADNIVAPMFVEILSRIEKVPLIPEKPYWHHHFTDGKVWNEYLAESMGLDIENKLQYENHAFGGSWAVTDDKQTTFWDFVQAPEKTLMNIIKGKLVPPSLGLVVESYLLDLGKANPNSLYFLLAGGNDYLNYVDTRESHSESKLEKYAANVVHGVISSARKLLKSGATQMVIFGVPDVSLTPHFNTTENRQLLAHITKYHNALLERSVGILGNKYPDKKLVFVNMQALMQELVDNPLQYGISDTEHACIDLPLPVAKIENTIFPNNLVLQNATLRADQVVHECSAPTEYLFWDEIHPTTHAHRILSDRVYDILKKSGV